MGQIIATCGHEIYAVPERGVWIKEYGGETGRMISYSVLCPSCLEYYKEAGDLFETKEEAFLWLSEK